MKPEAESIRIVIADDHQIMRDGLAAIMKKTHFISLLGEASDGKELVELVSALRPDVVLTDISMPRMNGVEATRFITKNFPGTGVLALSVFDDEKNIIDMIKAGARGYLLKNSSKEELLEAIRTVYRNENYYYNSISKKLISYISNSEQPPAPPEPRIIFSEKETEIIKLICQQYTSKEIAGRLHVSYRSVEGYKERIQKKIDARNMIGIVIYAIKHGIYSLREDNT
ncbi:MAG TPA: response regulator transcription factor [Chitinophagaceae bacterium]|nr:response regulator transcription factor [Chitinophagaceae bacterium]